MPKAIKQCPECGSDIHAARKKCYCGYKFFDVRNKKVKGLAVDWKDLIAGDYVRIYSNDHWKPHDDDNPDSVVMIGNSGKFQVLKVYHNGLLLYNKYGCCYQDMTSTGVGKSGIIREIPKIVKIRHDKSITRSKD